MITLLTPLTSSWCALPAGWFLSRLTFKQRTFPPGDRKEGAFSCLLFIVFVVHSQCKQSSVYPESPVLLYVPASPADTIKSLCLLLLSDSTLWVCQVTASSQTCTHRHTHTHRGVLARCAPIYESVPFAPFLHLNTSLYKPKGDAVTPPSTLQHRRGKLAVIDRARLCRGADVQCCNAVVFTENGC